MKLERFKEKNNKKKFIIVFTIICVLLVSGVVLYRTFAIFEVKTNLNMIKGTIEDPGNIYFAFYVNNKIEKEMPDRNGGFVLDEEASSCEVNGSTTDSIKVSLTEDWEIVVSGVTFSRTKCNLYFKNAEKLIDILQKESIKQDNSGESGIYEVFHDDATITYTSNSAEITSMKQKELRYAGPDPNNYVKLGNDMWRIIGLVNTPEGQRIKLVRNESIGAYSWDSSDTNVNEGAGVNEWSQADLMFELNYMYLSSQNGNCYSAAKNSTKSCNFSDIGLKDEIEFVDTVTWNLGSTNDTTRGMPSYNAKEAYDWERSSTTGKTCESGNRCNDNIKHYATWKGMIGLLAPTDIIYASSGNSTANRETCFSFEKLRSTTDCKATNYLITDTSKMLSEWLMNPNIYGNNQSANVVAIYYQSSSYLGAGLSTGAVYAALNVRPSFYLKENVLVKNGDGSKESPYEFAI